MIPESQICTFLQPGDPAVRAVAAAACCAAARTMSATPRVRSARCASGAACRSIRLELAPAPAYIGRRAPASRVCSSGARRRFSTNWPRRRLRIPPRGGTDRLCVRLGARSAARSCAICADRQCGPRRVARQAGGAAVGWLEAQAISNDDQQDRGSSRSRRRPAHVGWCGQRDAGGLGFRQQLVVLGLRCGGDSEAQLGRAGQPGRRRGDRAPGRASV